MTNSKRTDVVDSLFEFVGIVFIFLAVATLGLFIANVRSHLKYGSSNYHLEWVVAYFLVTGIGVRRMKRWGVLLLFVPAAETIFAMMTHPEDSWLLPLAWCAAFSAIPIVFCRRWKSLTWA